MGLEESTLWNYLNILNNMIQYAIENGYQTISYGYIGYTGSVANF